MEIETVGAALSVGADRRGARDSRMRDAAQLSMDGEPRRHRLELNPHGARRNDLEHPDGCRGRSDPGPGVEPGIFAEACDVLSAADVTRQAEGFASGPRQRARAVCTSNVRIRGAGVVEQCAATTMALAPCGWNGTARADHRE